MHISNIKTQGGLKGITSIAWATLSFLDEVRLFFDAFHSREVQLLPTNKINGSLYYILEKMPKIVVDAVANNWDIPKFRNDSHITPLNQVLLVLEERIRKTMIQDQTHAGSFLSNFADSSTQVERPFREYYPLYDKAADKQQPYICATPPQALSAPNQPSTRPRHGQLHHLSEDEYTEDEYAFYLPRDLQPLDQLYHLYRISEDEKHALHKDYRRDAQDMPGKKGCFRLLWQGVCRDRYCKWGHDRAAMSDAWLTHKRMLDESSYAPEEFKTQRLRTHLPPQDNPQDSPLRDRPPLNRHIRFDSAPDAPKSQPWRGHMVTDDPKGMNALEEEEEEEDERAPDRD